MLLSPQAVDRFINGDYYRHPLTAEAILDVAQGLRVRLQACQIHGMLCADMDGTRACHEKSLHGSPVLVTLCARPAEMVSF